VEVLIVWVVLRARGFGCIDDYSSSDKTLSLSNRSPTMFLSPLVGTWLRRTSAQPDPLVASAQASSA
jgi:hypothetical protein